MQELPIFVDQCPENAQASQGDAWPGEQIAQYGLQWAQTRAIGADDLKFPGLHGQGLTAIQPAPDKIGHQYENDMYPEKLACQLSAKSGQDDLGEQKSNQ